MQKKTIRNFAVKIAALLVILIIFPFQAHADETGSNAVEEACKGVVRILAVDEYGNGATGSGFGVGKAGEPTDIYVTNWHVVTGLGGFKGNASVYILTSDDAAVRDKSGILRLDESKMVKCEVLYTTTGYPDVAILKAEHPIEDHVALPVMEAEKASRGEPVYTLGFPASADTANGEKYLYAEISHVDIATGVLSKFFKFEIGGDTMSIQHDAHINHGNSGGPLITKNGAVIGINTYGYGELDSMEYSVSIYVDYALEALDTLGIDYEVYTPGDSIISGPEEKGNVIVVIAVAAAAVVLIFTVVLRKKPSSPNKAHSPAAEAAAAMPVNTPVSPPAVTMPVNTPAAPVRNPNDNGLRMIGVSGVFAGRRFALKETVRIGRDPARNNLVYPPGTPGISGVHCEIHVREGRVFLCDKGSSYGTWLRGTKIPSGQMVPVNSGESFYLGTPEQNFQIIRKQS